MPNSTWAFASRLASANDGEADARAATATRVATRAFMGFWLTMPPALRGCKAFGASILAEASKPCATVKFGKHATFSRSLGHGFTNSGQRCPRAAIIQDGRSGSARHWRGGYDLPPFWSGRVALGGVVMTDLQ